MSRTVQVVLVAVLVNSASAQTNNVCPTWRDYWTMSFNTRCAYNNDLYLDIPEMSEKYGHPVETHETTTDDGYILTMFRIKARDASARSVVVVHGIYQNAFAWFAQGNDSLAYVLARREYDVWVINMRGTKYSRHVDPNITAHQFWDFSVHDMGVRDMPAILKYVYAQNGGRKIVSVNFSMGTTVAMIYSSTLRQEAAQYLERVVALAPVAHLKENTSILGRLQWLWTPLKSLLNFARLDYVLHAGDGIETTLSLFFLLTPVHMWRFGYVQGLIFGFDMDQINPWTISMLVKRSGDAIGVNVIEHYVQIIRSDVFAALDFKDEKANLMRYGSATPPVYDLSSVQVPFTFIYGKNDAVATRTNVLRTFKDLPGDKNCIIELEYANFNHQDFFLGKDVYKMLYKDMSEDWMRGACPGTNSNEL